MCGRGLLELLENPSPLLTAAATTTAGGPAASILGRPAAAAENEGGVERYSMILPRLTKLRVIDRTFF